RGTSATWLKSPGEKELRHQLPLRSGPPWFQALAGVPIPLARAAARLGLPPLGGERRCAVARRGALGMLSRAPPSTLQAEGPMQPQVCLLVAFGVLTASGTTRAGDKAAAQQVGQATDKAAAAKSYSFQIEERPGRGTGGAFSGKYAQGQPTFFMADGI